jgi:hypothetical protein
LIPISSGNEAWERATTSSFMSLRCSVSRSATCTWCQ